MKKLVISVPDALFERAQRLGRRTKKSPSRLFTDALKEYLTSHTPDLVTEAMNSALAYVGETCDPFIAISARHILERSEW